MMSTLIPYLSSGVLQYMQQQLQNRKAEQILHTASQGSKAPKVFLLSMSEHR